MGKNNELSGIILIIVLVGLAIWGVTSLYNNYKYGEKKPFWKGTELVQVCKKPYYSSEDCKGLLVTLIDNKNAKIKLENGNYVYTYDITCYFAAQSVPNAPKYIFCRSWDENKQQWDFMPEWARLPTFEEDMKRVF